MIDTPITEPVTPVLVAHVDSLTRRRNRAIVAIAVIVAAALVAMVGFSEWKLYETARDARAAADHTVGLQRANRDLLKVVLAVTGCTVADTPDECRSKVAAASTAEGGRRVAQVRGDMQAIVDLAVAELTRCIDNHTDVVNHLAAPLPDCPSGPATATSSKPPTTTTTTTTPGTRPGPAPPVRSPSTTQPPLRSCALKIGDTCILNTTAAAPASGFGCGPALAYLAAHAAPGFTFGCAPHSAHGALGMTCVNHPPQCAPGEKTILIACPAPVVYQNEAENSIVLTGGPGRIDAYGQWDPRCQGYA